MNDQKIQKHRIPRKTAPERFVWDKTRRAAYVTAKERGWSRPRFARYVARCVHDYMDEGGVQGCEWMVERITDWVWYRRGTWIEPSRRHRLTPAECARGGRARGHRSPKRAPNQIRRSVHRLRKQGMSIRRIADTIGWSKSFVHRTLHEPPPPETKTDRRPRPKTTTGADYNPIPPTHPLYRMPVGRSP